MPYGWQGHNTGYTQVLGGLYYVIFVPYMTDIKLQDSALTLRRFGVALVLYVPSILSFSCLE